MTAGILLIADLIDNTLLSSYKDLLGIANLLSSSSASGATLVIPVSKPFSEERIGEIMQTAAETGISPIDIVMLTNPAFQHPNPPLIADALQSLIRELEPGIICFPHTMRNCQTAASLAMRLRAEVIAGVESVVQKQDQFVFQRSLMNGKWVATVTPHTLPYILTVNTGAFSNIAAKNIGNDTGRVIRKTISQETDTYISLDIEAVLKKESSLEEAEVIVAAGRGIADPENLDLIRQTASVFKNAGVGASRPLCDSGWLSYEQQIGETGRQVSPKLYLACGISGASQHLAGMRGSQCIVAVNTDSGAAILNIAHYGIIEDVRLFLPALIQKYEEMFG
ncbi:MAG: electron transfer flavoprotein subunit alpha/FixB family protein [Desulfobacterales bacterium]|nr:electron transfer flavoprotein subunit alpha/FixB family protein [Desulfobacterales bacterium]